MIQPKDHIFNIDTQDYRWFKGNDGMGVHFIEAPSLISKGFTFLEYLQKLLFLTEMVDLMVSMIILSI